MTICPVCQSSHTRQILTAANRHGQHLFDTNQIPIHRCYRCQSIYPHLNIDKNFYQLYYPQDYQTSDPPTIEKLLNYLSFNIKQIIIRFYSPKLFDTLIDIGSGSGLFLKSLPNHFTKTGIDINPIPIPNTISIKDDFLKHNFSKSKFHIATLWHVLEHTQDPNLFLQKISSILRPSGLLFLTIPNTDSLGFKYGQSLWYHLDSPRHLFIPSKNALINLLKSNGFVIISIFNPFWEYPLDLFHSLKHSPIFFLLLPLYPILKMFSSETLFVVAKKN
jgi:SAM-dependent methyltransferase